MKKKCISALIVVFSISFNCFVSAQTTIILQPDGLQGKDAQVWSNGPNTNIGNHQSLTAYGWTNGGIPGRKRILLDFDLSQIPSNAEITSAKLSLYYNPDDDIEGFNVHSGDNKALIRRVVQDWDEATVTWNSLPSTTSQGQIQIPASTTPTQNYENLNVTTLVQAMIDDPNGSHGFLLRIKREQPYRSILFASSDHPDESKHPKLEITYTTTLKGKKLTGTTITEIQMYPNPVGDILNLNTDKFQEESVLVTITNCAGQNVYSTTISSSANEVVSLEELPSGIYFITIQDTTNFITQKIIKE
ncbi:MAG TPA: DNRLRE domain-containing protein [Chitinophagales bacterium]|nr:DNRLRE domain-containing protein [Chitinophagales bacterium]